MHTLFNILLTLVVVLFVALGESMFKEHAALNNWKYPKWLSVAVQATLMAVCFVILFLMGWLRC